MLTCVGLVLTRFRLLLTRFRLVLTRRRNLKESVVSGELIRNFNKKKKSGVIDVKLIDVYYVSNFTGEMHFSKKHVEYCESIR